MKLQAANVRTLLMSVAIMLLAAVSYKNLLSHET